MPRIARARRAADLHHVVNRGARRLPIFSDDADRAAFIGILGDALAEFDAKCAALCLMDNHYHLLLQANVDVLGRVMQRVSARYTARFNHRQEFDGPLFKGRFFSSPVLDDAYLARCVRYIYRNPLDISRKMSLTTYHWSTFRHHMGLAPCPPWMDPAIGLQVLGGRGALRDFVLDDERDVPNPIQIQEWFERSGLDKTSARRIAVLVAADAGWSDEEIGASLGIASRSTVRYHRSKAQAETTSRPDVSERIAAFEQTFLLSRGVAGIGPKWLRQRSETA